MTTTTVFDFGLTHRGDWVACEQPPITLPLILAYTRGDRDRLKETASEEGKGLGEHESPGRERGAGDDRDSNAISIRSRGELIFTAFYSRCR